jgi:hypothetical protein
MYNAPQLGTIQDILATIDDKSDEAKTGIYGLVRLSISLFERCTCNASI